MTSIEPLLFFLPWLSLEKLFCELHNPVTSFKCQADLYTKGEDNDGEFESQDDIWKHWPWLGLGRQISSFQTVYDSKELPGRMEPHTFAKFACIFVNASFDFDEEPVPEIFIEDNSQIRRQDELAFAEYLKKSTTIERLADLLSMSHHVKDLKISFDMHVTARWNGDRYENDESDSESVNEGDSKEPSLRSKRQAAVNQRAMEVFFDSNVLKPLLKLSNVRRLEFSFESIDLTDCVTKTYSPLERHEVMLTELEEAVEHNWRIAHEAR